MCARSRPIPGRAVSGKFKHKGKSVSAPTPLDPTRQTRFKAAVDRVRFPRFGCSVRIARPARRTNPATGALADYWDYWLYCALAERDAAAARNAVIAAGQNPALTDDVVAFSRPFMEGVIARMTKDDAEARAAFAAARGEQTPIAAERRGLS